MVRGNRLESQIAVSGLGEPPYSVARVSLRVGLDRKTNGIRWPTAVKRQATECNTGVSPRQAPSATLNPVHPRDPPYKALERSRTLHREYQ